MFPLFKQIFYFRQMSASLPMPQNFVLIGTKNVSCVHTQGTHKEHILFSNADCHLKMFKSFFPQKF